MLRSLSFIPVAVECKSTVNQGRGFIITCLIWVCVLYRCILGFWIFNRYSFAFLSMRLFTRNVIRANNNLKPDLLFVNLWKLKCSCINLVGNVELSCFVYLPLCCHISYLNHLSMRLGSIPNKIRVTYSTTSAWTIL